MKKAPVKTCADCIHEYACQAWNVGTIHNMDASTCHNRETVKESGAYFIGLSDARRAILALPAADVAPVRHGQWIMRGGLFRCSECDGKARWKKSGGTGGWSCECEQDKSPFCPHCGAKMDKEAPK